MADQIPGKFLAELPFLPDAIGAELYGEKGGSPWRLKAGEPNGLQTLDSSGKVPLAQLPDAPEDDAPEDVRAAWETECEQARRAHAEAVAAWKARRAHFDATLEVERRRWDRMALCGQVPVNIEAAPGDVGKFVVAVEGPNDTIAAALLPRAEVTAAVLPDVVGRVVRVGDDGRAIVLVRQ